VPFSAILSVIMQPTKTRTEIFDFLSTFDPVAYSKTRNHLTGQVSKLSPYISRGVITLPEIRDHVLTRATNVEAEKFIQELAWREYFQRVWWAKGDAIFSDLRFPRNDWRHEDLVKSLVEAQTGVTTIDTAIIELSRTGYMHNHARLWVASLGTNLARAHWYNMGRWLYAHLADGDIASNFLSWQWVAGTSVSKPYTVDQSLINSWSSTKQPYSILNFRREDMLLTACPEVLMPTLAYSYVMEYPSNTIHSVAGETVALYTPWTLLPTLAPEADRHILIFDPEWFDRFPVTDQIRDFILAQGKAVLPSLEVWSGTYNTIPGIALAKSQIAVAHQTNQSWVTVNRQEPAWLFPQVRGYYPSFFSYWQEASRYL
jgi:deoxyribodipyrimidine photo-lyase